MNPGDSFRLIAARSAAREGFESGRELLSSDEEVVKQIQHAEGVAQVLRENLVQGKAVDEEGIKYSM